MEFATTFEYLILCVADRTSPLHQDAPWPGSSRGEWIWTTSQMISASAYITSSRAANCPMTAPRRSQDARQLAKPAPPVKSAIDEGLVVMECLVGAGAQRGFDSTSSASSCGTTRGDSHTNRPHSTFTC